MDRNREQFKYVVQCRKSLSARRAWIEISGGASGRLSALSSLSARRAWIEIFAFLYSTTETSGRSPQGERG